MILLQNMIGVIGSIVPYDGMSDDNFGIFDHLEVLNGFSLSRFTLDNPKLLKSEILQMKTRKDPGDYGLFQSGRSILGQML